MPHLDTHCHYFLPTGCQLLEELRRVWKHCHRRGTEELCSGRLCSCGRFPAALRTDHLLPGIVRKQEKRPQGPLRGHRQRPVLIPVHLCRFLAVRLILRTDPGLAAASCRRLGRAAGIWFASYYPICLMRRRGHQLPDPQVCHPVGLHSLA